MLMKCTAITWEVVKLNSRCTGFRYCDAFEGELLGWLSKRVLWCRAAWRARRGKSAGGGRRSWTWAGCGVMHSCMGVHWYLCSHVGVQFWCGRARINAVLFEREFVCTCLCGQ